MTNVINKAHQNRHPGRADHPELRLVVRRRHQAEGPPRQRRPPAPPSPKNIAVAVRDRGADGVNLDFEPLAAGYADEFVSLVRGASGPSSNAVAKGYQLTFDTTGYIGNYPIEAATAAGGADAIFIMGYDYRSSGSSPVGSIAPIGGAAYDITDTVKAYTARVPASKLILGVPYYGRAWSTSSDSLNASNTSWHEVRRVEHRDLRERHHRPRRSTASATTPSRASPGPPTAARTARRPTAASRRGGSCTWTTPTALKAKYDIVNNYGLRGAGIWALGYDNARPELWNAIKTKFVSATPFTDVNDFAVQIEWLYTAGITAGCSPTLFCPKGKVTRAQMALFLDRALDLPDATTDYFDDDDGKTGEGSINALAKARITGGCGPRRFCPTAAVTRAQMAMFLDRALGLPNGTTDYFDDDDGKTGEVSINALAASGITGGCGPRLYCPTRAVTREQMAAFLYRAHLQGRLD